MLVFGSVLLTDSTEICLFRITSLGWSQILAKINEGDVCLLLLSIFVARESQCLQWSHLAKSLGQAANFEVQLTTTTQQQHNFAFYAASTCTWELCSGGGDLLKVQPGHSIGPRKLWNAGALTCVIHPYLACLFYLQRAFIQVASLPRRWRARSWAISARVLAPLLPDGDSTASRYPGRTCQVCDCTLRITWACNRSTSLD